MAVSWGRVLFAIWLTCFGCMEAPPRPAAPSGPAQAPPLRVVPSPPALGPSEAAHPKLPIRFEPVPTTLERGEAPQLKIESPLLGKQIPASKAASTPIRLQTKQWSNDLSVVLLLDDFIPRVFDDPSKPIELGQLLPENRDLEPGPHSLFAAAMLPDGTTIHLDQPKSSTPWSFVPFSIAPDSDSTASDAMASFTAPMIVLVSPRGTYNGNRAADHVLLDFHVLGGAAEPSAASVKVRVEAQLSIAEEQHEAWLAPTGITKITGLPSGDHRISVSLTGADGRPVESPRATATRTITINRDAPVE